MHIEVRLFYQKHDTGYCVTVTGTTFFLDMPHVGGQIFNHYLHKHYSSTDLHATAIMLLAEVAEIFVMENIHW